MRKIALFLITFAFYGCNTQEQVIFENQTVDLERFYPLINNTQIPQYIQGCTIIGYTKKGQSPEEINPNFIDGKTLILDRDSNKLAEWKYNASKSYYSDMKFYRTQDGINYCYIEYDGKASEEEDGYRIKEGIRNEYALSDNIPYLFTQNKFSAKEHESIEYYPNKQIKHRIQKKAQGKPSMNEMGDEYYELTTVVDEYFKSDGSRATITDLIFLDHDHAIFTSNLTWSGFRTGDLVLILFPSTNDIMQGKARFISTTNIKKSFRCDSEFDYHITDSEIKFYNGYGYGLYGKGDKRWDDSIFTISAEDQGIALKDGKYRHTDVIFTLTNISLSDTWLERIRRNE